MFLFTCFEKHFENLEIMESKLPLQKGLFQMGILLSMISRFSKCFLFALYFYHHHYVVIYFINYFPPRKRLILRVLLTSMISRFSKKFFGTDNSYQAI